MRSEGGQSMKEPDSLIKRPIMEFSSWLMNVELKDLWEKTLRTIYDVLEAYGMLLEKYPLAICDVSMLPLSKFHMKKLFKALRSRANSAEQEQALENSFLFLSNFQEGVGPEPLDESITKDVSPADKVTILDHWLSWENIAAAELQELIAEWKRFEAGEPL